MPHASITLRKPKDLVFGFILVCIAVGMVTYSGQYALGTARQMGPGYLPLVLGLVLGVLGTVLAVGSFFGEREPFEAIGIRPSFLILSAAALFGLLIRPAGLIVGIVALVVVAGFAYPSRKPIPLLICAAGLAAGCVIVFPWLLGQQIPVLGTWFVR
jgi:putative tricarboxylic transport membrane protein